MLLTVPPQPIPPHPLPLPFPPSPPLPEPEHRAPLQPPMVYVATVWEYRHLHRALEGDAPPIAEDELNALGAEGWELTAVLPAPSGVHVYLKRAAT